MPASTDVEVDIMALAPGVPRAQLAEPHPAPVADVAALLTSWFPGRIGAEVGTSNLRDAVAPGAGTVCAGIFGDTVLLCAQQLTELADLTALMGDGHLQHTLFHLRITTDPDGVALDVLTVAGLPVRELLVVDGEGVVYDEGPRMDFEQPFWSGPDGASPPDETEMPFAPVSFGQAALRTLFGFSLDGAHEPGDLDPRRIDLACFQLLPEPAPSSGNDGHAGRPVEVTAQISADGSAARPLPAVQPPDDEARRSAGSPPGGAPDAGGVAGAEPSRRSWWRRLLDRLRSRS